MLNAYGSVQDWNPDVERQDKDVFLAANRKPRDLALLCVNKFIFREAGRTFFHKLEFRFEDWVVFSGLWRAKDKQNMSQRIPLDDHGTHLVPPVFQPRFGDIENDLSCFRQNLRWCPEQFNQVRSIAHISLVGVGWGDQLVDTSELAQVRSWNLATKMFRTKAFAGTVPYMLAMFPGLRQLDVGAAMLREFADYASDIGQLWQPVMNILRRNQGSLKAVLMDELVDIQRPSAWVDREVRMEASITIPARGKMPLREATWTLEEVSAAIQLEINQTAPATFMTVTCRGKKHTVRLHGVPLKVSDIHQHKADNKWRANNLRRAQQYDKFSPPGFRKLLSNCLCRFCKARKKVHEARASLTKEFRQYGGRQPKWAKHIDLSFDGGDEADDEDDSDDGCSKAWRNGRPVWARKVRNEEDRAREQSAADGNSTGSEDEDEDEDGDD